LKWQKRREGGRKEKKKGRGVVFSYPRRPSTCGISEHERERGGGRKKKKKLFIYLVPTIFGTHPSQRRKKRKGEGKKKGPSPGAALRRSFLNPASARGRGGEREKKKKRRKGDAFFEPRPVRSRSVAPRGKKKKGKKKGHPSLPYSSNCTSPIMMGEGEKKEKKPCLLCSIDPSPAGHAKGEKKKRGGGGGKKKQPVLTFRDPERRGKKEKKERGGERGSSASAQGKSTVWE